MIRKGMKLKTKKDLEIQLCITLNSSGRSSLLTALGIACKLVGEAAKAQPQKLSQESISLEYLKDLQAAVEETY